VLSEPDETRPSIKERFNAFKTTDNVLLRVTYREEAQRIIVVTVTPRRHA